jgi:hypothetical protein
MTGISMSPGRVTEVAQPISLEFTPQQYAMVVRALRQYNAHWQCGSTSPRATPSISMASRGV